MKHAVSWMMQAVGRATLPRTPFNPYHRCDPSFRVVRRVLQTDETLDAALTLCKKKNYPYISSAPHIAMPRTYPGLQLSRQMPLAVVAQSLPKYWHRAFNILYQAENESAASADCHETLSSRVYGIALKYLGSTMVFPQEKMHRVMSPTIPKVCRWHF